MSANNSIGPAKITALAFSIFVWLSLLLVGVSLYSGIVSQGVSGFPNSGQRNLYILFPLAMLFLNIVFVMAVKKIPTTALVTLSALQFFPAIVVFLLFSGGV